jgi:hypothetical protein
LFPWHGSLLQEQKVPALRFASAGTTAVVAGSLPQNW